MKYFTIQELTHTNTGLENNPNVEQIKSLILLIDNILDPARELLGKKIKVNSGFRSIEVNNTVKGSKTSQHLKGEAADITCYDNKKLFNIINNNFQFDQLINEYNYSWIHVSYSKNNRNQLLTIH